MSLLTDFSSFILSNTYEIVNLLILIFLAYQIHAKNVILKEKLQSQQDTITSIRGILDSHQSISKAALDYASSFDIEKLQKNFNFDKQLEIQQIRQNYEQELSQAKENISHAKNAMRQLEETQEALNIAQSNADRALQFAERLQSHYVSPSILLISTIGQQMEEREFVRLIKLSGISGEMHDSLMATMRATGDSC